MDYDEDEALRIVSATAMFEDHTYGFRVNSSGGMFAVMFERHEFPKAYRTEPATCCKHDQDPCMHISRDLKDAIRRSIKEHHDRFHFLKQVR